MLLKSGQVTTRGQAATHLAVHRNTVATWLRLYRQGGLDALLTLKQPGAPAGQKSLPLMVFEQLKARLNTPKGFASYLEVQQGLRDEYGLALGYKTVHGIVHYQLHAKLKHPRPHHAKKTRQKRLTLSNSARRLGTIATLSRQRPAQPVRVFCQDESRLGLQLPVRRRLTGYGVKPVQVVELLYESYWLYAAVEPTTGDAFWWELPSLDADCFMVFLRQFGQHYAESLNIILLWTSGSPAFQFGP